MPERSKHEPPAKEPFNNSARVLVIDDCEDFLGAIRSGLARPGLEIFTEKNRDQGIEAFLRIRPQIVLLNSLTGPETLERLIALDPALDILLTSPSYSARAAIDAIQQGACDYLTKPIDIEWLRSRIEILLAEAATRLTTLRLENELTQAYEFEGIVGRSPRMLDVFAQLRRVAPHFRTALVTGPTGTGKELIAKALHNLSPAARGRFVVCNCAALSDNLVESELFGHVRGAFTGASQDKIGMFEHADHGTIFLDEIGELTPAAQAKLLRVLQNHQVQRVGSSSARMVDIRVIAATHCDLRAMVRDSRFREDLFYRLSVVEIRLPPLAHRREDLPLLERHFIKKFSAEYKKPVAGIVRGAQIALAKYPWPGNIRELENVIGNACLWTDSNLIEVDDLPQPIREPANPGSDEISLSLQEVQRRHVLHVLEEVGGNKTKAAEVLGISRSAIYQLLSGMKIEAAGRHDIDLGTLP